MNNKFRLLFPSNTQMSFTKSVYAGVILFLVNAILALFTWLIPFNKFFSSELVGNNTLDAYSNQKYIYVMLFIIVPISVFIEELIFRYIPYLAYTKIKRINFWYFGIINSLLFAYIHDPMMFIQLRGFPLPQFIAGLYLWYYIPTGLRSTTIIHLVNNLIVVGTVFFATYIGQ